LLISEIFVKGTFATTFYIFNFATIYMGRSFINQTPFLSLLFFNEKYT